MHTLEGRHLSGVLLATFHLLIEYVVSKLNNMICLSSVERDGFIKSESHFIT